MDEEKIVRCVDERGRVVLPKKIRNFLFGEGDDDFFAVEMIMVEGEKSVVLKKATD